MWEDKGNICKPLNVWLTIINLIIKYYEISGNEIELVKQPQIKENYIIARNVNPTMVTF